MDAYYTTVNEKIILPAEQGQRILPAEKEFILDMPTQNQVKRRTLTVLALVASPILICGWATRLQGKLWTDGITVYPIIIGNFDFVLLASWLNVRVGVKRSQQIQFLLIALLGPLMFFALLTRVNPLPLSFLVDFYIVGLFFMSIIRAAYWGDGVIARRKAKKLATSLADHESAAAEPAIH